MIRKFLNSLLNRETKKNTPPPMKELPMGPEPGPGKNSEDELLGKHYEGMGYVWDAVFGYERAYLNRLHEIIQKGRLDPDCHLFYKKQAARLAFLQYHIDGPMLAGVLLVQLKTDELMRYWAGYPVMQGQPNRVTIIKTHTWYNGVQGLGAAEPAPQASQRPLTFYLPFYFRDFQLKRPGAELVLQLSAIALSLKNADPKAAPPAMPAAKPLPLNDKDSEFRSIMSNLPSDQSETFTASQDFLPQERALRPGKYSCDWEFQGPVLAVEPFNFMGMKFLRIDTAFAAEGGKELKLYLYASQVVYQDYTPQAGDMIQGQLWLQAYLDESAAAGQPGEEAKEEA